MPYVLGGKVVEVGCFGGHGRTGTLLALIIGEVEGLNAPEAIKAIRTRYCDKAVETYDQVEGIARYLGGDVSHIKADTSKISYYSYQGWD
jgi:protein-tyrosine phosphatase